MNNTPLTLRLGLILLGTNLVFCGQNPAQAAQPTVLIEDTFTVRSGKREANSPLGKQETEKGSVSWKTEGNLVISPEGRVTCASADSHLASVPLGDTTGTLTIRATINPKGAEWIGVAFMEKGNLTDFWKDAKISAIFRPTGQYEILLYNTEVVALGSGKVSDWIKGEPNMVELTYDPVEPSVSVKVNGNSVLDKTKIDFQPRIHHACFHLLHATEVGVPTVDDFSVSEISAP